MKINLLTEPEFQWFWTAYQPEIDWVRLIIEDPHSIEPPPRGPYCADKLRQMANAIEDYPVPDVRRVPARTINGRFLEQHIRPTDGYHRLFVLRALDMPIDAELVEPNAE